MQNASVEIAKSAQRTVSSDIPLENPECAGMNLIIDCTAQAGGSITVSVQGVDVASGKKYPILVSAAIAAVGTTVLRIGRNLAAVANLVANDQLPKRLNVNVTHNNANPITYSIGGALIL